MTVLYCGRNFEPPSPNSAVYFYIPSCFVVSIEGLVCSNFLTLIPGGEFQRVGVFLFAFGCFAHHTIFSFFPSPLAFHFFHKELLALESFLWYGCRRFYGRHPATSTAKYW